MTLLVEAFDMQYRSPAAPRAKLNRRWRLRPRAPDARIAAVQHCAVTTLATGASAPCTWTIPPEWRLSAAIDAAHRAPSLTTAGRFGTGSKRQRTSARSGSQNAPE